MKLLIATISALILGVVLVIASPVANSKNLLGARECTWGPGYWCSNLTNAKNCRAVRHCIQTVWETKTVPEDNDSICKICLDMVKQARDQLESNQTQDDLKAVFEGSCKLIPIKEIQKECIKLVDEFVPELVETLASQMNPQVVCSVAGLCNNPAIDKMLLEYAASKENNKVPPTTEAPVPIEPPEKQTNTFTCSGCNNIATIIANKFSSKNSDDVLEDMLHACGKLSSYSDACSSIVLTHFNDIYTTVKDTLTSDSICHMSGICANKYHQHPGDVEVLPRSDVGFVPVKDDIPCELCQQLMKHLKEVLIANTTEDEFKRVLEGLCKQTHGFKDECLSIVDQYYVEIYNSLVNDLDDGACFMIGICQKGLKGPEVNRPLAPLLPVLPSQAINVTLEQLKPLPQKKLGESEPKLTKQEVHNAQLPIDRLMGAPLPEILIENGQLCTLCQYFLHFVQEALATPANEDEIKKVVGTTCDKFPKSLQDECHTFINMYGDAIIALLIQELDPRLVCPMLKMCPEHTEDMEVFSPKEIKVVINTEGTNDKPTCPLCLFAVQQAKEMISNNKTKENIRRALDHLCSHLPQKLQLECTDFIDTYANELVEMLITDFTPQQICSYLRLCTDDEDNTIDYSLLFYHTDKDIDIMTNEIFDDTVNGRPVDVEKPPRKCRTCQKFVKKIESKIVNKKSREQIKNALDHACDKLEKKIRRKCQAYINKHEDQLIDLILKGYLPKQICKELSFCDYVEIDHDNNMESFVHPPPPPPPPMCKMCDLVIDKASKDATSKSREQIKHDLQAECDHVAVEMRAQCKSIMEKFADKIVDEILKKIPKLEICMGLGLCVSEPEDLDIDEALSISVVAVPANHEDIQFGRLTGIDDISDTDLGKDTPPCVLCEFIMVKLEEELRNKKTKEEIKHTIESICHKMPKTVTNKCDRFIEQYADMILELIDTIPPKEICMRLNVCEHLSFDITDGIVECGVCHGVVVALSDIYQDPEVDHNLENLTEMACEILPAKYHSKCSQLIEYYGQSIVNLLNNKKDLSKICGRIGMCFESENSKSAFVQIAENDKLLQGKRDAITKKTSSSNTWRK